MSQKLVVANWKMNPQTVKEAELLLKSVNRDVKELKNVHVVVCPPFPYLYLARNTKTKKISLGAQDLAIESAGAHTGHVSAGMLTSQKVSYVIIGHSEQRAKGETNEDVNKKIILALKAKLIPIVCVGEQTRDAHGEYLKYIKGQLEACFSGISKAQLKNIVIAYEPIWAISSNGGREAVPEEFTEVRIYIRKVLSDIYGPKSAHAMRVLYGGSVGPTDVSHFIVEGGADGVLVGHNSLVPKAFSAILTAINNA